MITREFNLYLHAGHSIPLVINCNQYDRGEQWLFTLFNADGTQYVPSSGAIVGIKSDNLGIINSGTVDASGRVVINETQQMTAAVGKAVFELVIDDGTHGTANFVVLVEPKPGDNADLSETDISMIEQAIEAASTIKPYGSPLVASTVAGMTDETKVYVYTGSETGYTSGHWYYYDGDSWEDGGVYNSVAVQTDTTLALSGMAADSKKVGDELSDLKSQINNGIPYAVKLALDNIIQNVAFKNDDVYSADLATVHAWATSINVTSISAVYTQGGTVYDTDSLDDLKADLVVTANYDNGTSSVVSGYTLSGNLDSATSTITVTYEDKTTTFTVNVTLPVFDYLPSRDGALSTFEGITAYVSDASKWSESITNTGNLRIEGTGTTSDYWQFKIGSNPTTGKWRMRMGFEITSMSGATASGLLGVRPQISNGTDGVRVGFGTNGRCNAMVGSNVTEIGSITIGSSTWHDIELYLDSSVPVQRVTIDGNELLESATLGDGFKNNSLFFAGKCTAFVKSLKLYDQ